VSRVISSVLGEELAPRVRVCMLSLPIEMSRRVTFGSSRRGSGDKHSWATSGYGLAVFFKHQPAFAANKRGARLAGEALHLVENAFPFTSLSKLCSRIGEGNREEL
jgi:hypothetical protein